ncbi:hypothetical protein Y032_0018g3693 [Ancylostoma ceylanicum]|uniref:Uncharacterized protein n=1 Tax=Ancylostoma ceylanicum TaxID=53326 RepID=A0A016V3S3_9BILA|nr:hypothetical protein Y032_0018g3693 [Ancylostoma ceylanicum]
MAHVMLCKTGEKPVSEPLFYRRMWAGPRREDELSQEVRFRMRTSSEKFLCDEFVLIVRVPHHLLPHKLGGVLQV